MSEVRPKIAFWWRYAPADNIELAHATPVILERLAAFLDPDPVFVLAMRLQAAIPETKGPPSGSVVEKLFEVSGVIQWRGARYP